ncbi:T9SS type A sorting domain-containing protein [Marinoscillum pacificum]|uniref:T9SS type A sorting domain-containing protein n=1 Tax=Marinoscillum pacificum TaxID=392723 RepID=UPI00215788EF|nr:T9SS type A sorting domain-containing protein [Marinoscillum pacificum]
MYNKLIIATFALFLSMSALAQEANDNVVSAETAFYNHNVDLNKNRIELYPNPAVDYIVVHIDNSTLENAEFELHSLIGNEIKIEAEEIGNGRYRIPVKNYATGYYFIVVKDENTRFKKAFRFLKN